MEREPTAEALRRSRREPDAFGRFYSAHVESLLAFVTRRVYDVDTAWDLTGESFARAYLKRRTFRGTTDGEAAAWLFTIARREILQYQRRNVIERKAMRRLGVELPPLEDAEQARVVELAAVDELRAMVRAELERLSESQREALSLRVVEELSYEQVADRLGISEESARARVSRGLRALGAAIDAGTATQGAG